MTLANILGKVKRQKMLASKGVDSQKMWRDVSRSLDSITDITSTINEKLNIHDIDGERNTNVDREISKWRALLRHSNYLLENSSLNEAFNIYGELLSSDMINISQNTKEKMLQYFDIMKVKKRVHRSEVTSLRVLATMDELEDLLFNDENCDYENA